MKRLLLPLPDAPPGTARVEGDRFHHLVHVLRAGPGDELEVFDGRGRTFAARLEELGAAHATLALGPPRRVRPLRPVTVVQGLPKGEKMEAILQHGTELGASAFAPVSTERAVVKLSAERAEQRGRRWARIAEEAARQCGRADVPKVLPPRGLLEAVRELPEGTRVLVLDEEERSTTLAQAFSPLLEREVPVALVVGPEGGLTRAEVASLVEAGAVPVTLGRRTLRTETAALAALAVLRHLDGELG